MTKMTSEVIPGGEKAEGSRRCEKCGRDGQFARLIADPATSRRFDFFECTACNHPNWIELKK